MFRHYKKKDEWMLLKWVLRALFVVSWSIVFTIENISGGALRPVLVKLLIKMWVKLRDFRIPPSCSFEIRFSGMLRDVGWQLVTDFLDGLSVPKRR
jgi:hypothetical protein